MPAPNTRAAYRCAPAAHKRRARGSALITAVVFALIVALTLAGVSLLTVQHYSLAHVQADSTSAMDIAEAGINYELTRITNNVADADQPNGQYQSADNIDASLRGSFYVRCLDPATGGTWNGKNKVTIVCTGVVNGAQRTVSIDAAPSSTFYTMYSTGPGSYTEFRGNNAIVNGIAGTEGSFYIDPNLSSKPQIKSIVFNGGANAGFAPSDPGGYATVHNPKTVGWETVTSILDKRFSGGQSYLESNNDNSLATVSGTPASTGETHPDGKAILTNDLSVTGTEVVTLHGKPGGANYYLTGVTMLDHTDLKLDATKGPINIYYLNSEGKGQFIRGGHSVDADGNPLKDAQGNILGAKLGDDGKPVNPINIYTSATGTLNLDPNDANDEVDMGIYAYDTKDYYGHQRIYGGVSLNGSLNYHGQIIANSITVKDGAQITGTQGYFDQPNEYYAFSGNWREWAGNGSSGVYGGGNQ